MSYKKPLVSVIISTYNSEKFIDGKILNLINQTIFDSLEIIIVNSGSQQNEDQLIKKYSGIYKNIKYIKTENRETIYRAWNRAIEVAKGEFITNANTDDRLKKDALEILSDFLINNPDIALVYADQYISKIPNEEFESCINNKRIKMPEYDELLQLERCIVLSQPMWRASLHFNDNFWFDERYEICGDHEFELKISQKYKMKHLLIVLGTFFLSDQKENKSFRDLERVNDERREITFIYMKKYVNKLSNDELTGLRKDLIKSLRFPMVLNYLVRFILKKIIPDRHYFSFEFKFLMLSLIYERLGEIDKAIHFCKVYQRYGHSNRIGIQYKKLKSLK